MWQRALARAAVVLALGCAVATALAFQGCDRQYGSEAPAEPKKSAPRHPFETRYRSSTCDSDPYCRQLKRIWEDGGDSAEAIAENLRAADETVTFDSVEANAAEYEGTAWSFEGTISDIIAHETRGRGDYIVAEVFVDDDPGQVVAVRGDFLTDVEENQSVVVVGYLNGTSRPRPGTPPVEYRDLKIVEMSARAFLTSNEATALRSSVGAK